MGQGDGVISVNLFAAQSQAQAQNSQTAPAAQNRPNPVPDGGVVKVQARQQAAGPLVLDFPWKAPLGAAVFHRGQAIWIVFDAAAKLDLSALPRGSPLFAGLQPVQGPDYTALRIAAPAGETVTANAQGADWTVTLVPGAAAGTRSGQDRPRRRLGDRGVVRHHGGRHPRLLGRRSERSATGSGS